MLDEVGRALRSSLIYPQDDSFIFNGSQYSYDPSHFSQLHLSSNMNDKDITFIDGGQAHIIEAGNFCVSFIRIAAVTCKGKIKDHTLREFFVIVRATNQHNQLMFTTSFFPQQHFNVVISSKDESLTTSNKTATITSVVNMVRRFGELQLASSITSGFVVLDGTLDATYPKEEEYLANLGEDVCAIAKSSSLFMKSGNNANVFLMRKKQGTWQYTLNAQTSFVKLHSKSKHVFRMDGNSQLAHSLLDNSSDPVFLGYPYGLILSDKIARVSNHEKRQMQTTLLLDSRNKDIVEYLSTTNAHDILDNLS